jgi:hypothetical protein
MINHIDSAKLGTSGSVGVDTLYALNDSTIRYKKNGVFYNAVLPSYSRVVNDTTIIINGDTVTVGGSGGGGSDITTSDPLNKSGSNVSLNVNTEGLRINGTSLDAKVKVLNSAVTLRALTAADTSSVYRVRINREYGEFKFDPDDVSSVDDSVMVLVDASGNRFKRAVGQYVDVTWFGANGTDGVDDYTAIQKAINYVINNPKAPRDVYFPQGNYLISQPLILAKKSGNIYQVFSCNLIGQKGGYFTSSDYNVTIQAQFNDKFAIGFQRARSSIVSGIYVKGNFAPSFANLATQMATKFSDYVAASAGTFRDNRYSPYAGIVIDPFTSDGVSLGGNNYPGLDDWYTYATSGSETSGSSGIRIEDCRIQGFVVNFIIAPNGRTRNGENITVERVASDICKVSFASCNDQQKDNFYKQLVAWDRVHTIFDNYTYGAIGSPGQFHVDGVNLAGGISRIFNVNVAGYFPSFFKNIYGELVGTIGNIAGSLTSSVENMDLSLFDATSYSGAFPETFGNFKSVHFTNTTIRLYNGTNDLIPISVYGGVKFTESTTEQLYFTNIDFSLTPSDQRVTFDRKGSNPVQIGQNIRYNSLPLGELTLEDNITATTFTYRNNRNPFNYLNLGVVPVTKTGNNITFTAGSNFQYLSAGQHIVAYAANGYGVKHRDTLFPAIQGSDQVFYGTLYIGKIVSVNTTTGVIVVNNVPLEVVNGNSYYMYAMVGTTLAVPFVADMTNGSATATNVEAFNTAYPAVGEVYQGNFVGGFAIVTAVNSGAKTVTFDRVHFGTGSYDFVNGQPDITYRGLAANTLYFRKGKLITNNLTSDISRTGYYDTTKIHQVGYALEDYNPTTKKRLFYTDNGVTSKTYATEDWVTANFSGGGTVTGTGTANILPKWSSTSGITTSSLSDNGSKVSTSAATIEILSATGLPQIVYTKSNAGTNQKTWDSYIDDGNLYFRVVNDANSLANNWLRINRTGTTVNYASFAQPLLINSTTSVSGFNLQVTGKSLFQTTTGLPALDLRLQPDYRMEFYHNATENQITSLNDARTSGQNLALLGKDFIFANFNTGVYAERFRITAGGLFNYFANQKSSYTDRTVPDWKAVQELARDTALVTRALIPAQVNLIAGTNITITGTYPNLTINSSGGGGTSSETFFEASDANYTITTASGNLAINYYDALTADRTVTLPDPATNTGRRFTIRNGSVSYNINLSASIYENSSTSYNILAPGQSITFYSNGTLFKRIQ